MLVLERQPAEQIIVRVPGYSHPLRIVLLSIRGKQVRFGFDAPKEVEVVRSEADRGRGSGPRAA